MCKVESKKTAIYIEWPQDHYKVVQKAKFKR